MLLRPSARRSPRGGESEKGKKEADSRWSCSGSEAKGGEEEQQETGGGSSAHPQAPHCTCKEKISDTKKTSQIYSQIQTQAALTREMTDCFGEFSSYWGSKDNAEIIGHQWPMPHLPTNKQQTNKELDINIQ